MNIIQLSDYQRGSYLGTAHFYRFPDGSIRAMVTDMADWEIDAEPTISQRFEKFAGWLRDGAGSLMEQAKEFECPGEGAGNVNEPEALGVVASLADRGDTSANPTADDVLAKRACDLCGVTPYSEFRIHGEQIALVAIREARTNPPPVAEGDDYSTPPVDTPPPSDDFTLAAEDVEAADEAIAILYMNGHPPSQDAIRAMIHTMLRRGAEIGAAREREKVVAYLKRAGSPAFAYDIEASAHIGVSDGKPS